MNDIIDIYDKYAPEYADTILTSDTHSHRFDQLQKNHVRNHARILDLGCGPGNRMSAFWKNDPTCTLTGVDLSESMLDIARQTVPKATLLHQDMRSLDLIQRFEVILLPHSIIHLTLRETAQIMAKLSTMLCPGGILFISFIELHCSWLNTRRFFPPCLPVLNQDRHDIASLITSCSISIVEEDEELFIEQDGTPTTDVFLIGRKKS